MSCYSKNNVIFSTIIATNFQMVLKTTKLGPNTLQFVMKEEN